MATFDTITVNWNAGHQLRAVLESVANSDLQQHQLLRFVVVDNASSDQSSDNLEDLGLPLHLIHNEKNLGFGTACNQGASQSNADYLIFLNPDLRVENDTLAQLITFLEEPSNSHIGVVGGQLFNENGTVITQTCANFLRPKHVLYDALGLSALFPQYFSGLKMANWDHKDSRQVDHVIGALYCVRRRLFENVTGFDEDFFMYLEDLDLSLRLNKADGSAYYLTSARGFHKGGGTSEQIKAKRLALSLQSRIRYARKHFTFLQFLFVIFLTLFIEPFPRLILAIVRRSLDDVKHTIQGYLLLYGYLLKDLIR